MGTPSVARYCGAHQNLSRTPVQGRSRVLPTLLPPSPFPYPVPRINHREQITAVAVFVQFVATLIPSLPSLHPSLLSLTARAPCFSHCTSEDLSRASGGGALHLPHPANNPSAISSYSKNEARVGRRARTRCSWAPWCWKVKV